MAKKPLVRTPDEARDLIEDLHAALAAARPLVADLAMQVTSGKRREFVLTVLRNVDRALSEVEEGGRQ